MLIDMLEGWSQPQTIIIKPELIMCQSAPECALKECYARTQRQEPRARNPD